MNNQDDSTQKPSSPALEPKTPEEQKEAQEVKPPEIQVELEVKLPENFLTTEPQPSPLEFNPTTKAADPLPQGPTDAPKISVAQPNPPKTPVPTQPLQQPIDKKLQLDAIAKAVCRNQGHLIVALSLRQIIPSKAPGMPPEVIENTVVICQKCGASLAQIRGS